MASLVSPSFDVLRLESLMFDAYDLLIVGIISFALMTFSWIYQIITKNSNMVDVCWTFGIGGCALYMAINHYPHNSSTLAVLALGLAWSIRLGLHLLFNRVILSNKEDTRYAQLRKDRPKSYNSFLLWFVWFQAILVMIFSIPFFTIDTRVESPPSLIVVGIIIASISLIGSSIADMQLSQWTKNPLNKGKTCQQGLWKYSRHPNYFFEWLFWCSFPFICWAFPYGYLAFLVPILELWLLLKITGIPYTERCSLQSRSDYREYQLTTSAFIPWFKIKVL